MTLRNSQHLEMRKSRLSLSGSNLFIPIVSKRTSWKSFTRKSLTWKSSKNSVERRLVREEFGRIITFLSGPIYPLAAVEEKVEKKAD